MSTSMAAWRSISAQRFLLYSKKRTRCRASSMQSIATLRTHEKEMAKEKEKEMTIVSIEDYGAKISGIIIS